MTGQREIALFAADVSRWLVFFGFRRTIYPKRQIKNPMLTSTMPRNDAQSQLGTDSRRMSIPAAISTNPMFFAVRFPFLPPKKQNLLNAIASPAISYAPRAPFVQKKRPSPEFAARRLQPISRIPA